MSARQAANQYPAYPLPALMAAILIERQNWGCVLYSARNELGKQRSQK